jgi:hypothetical protein
LSEEGVEEREEEENEEESSNTDTTGSPGTNDPPPNARIMITSVDEYTKYLESIRKKRTGDDRQD